MKSNKVVAAIILLACFASIGYFRDELFKTINLRFYTLRHPSVTLDLPRWFSALQHWDFNTLYAAKYWLTAIFIILFFVLNALCVKVFIRRKNQQYLLRVGYLLGLLLMVIFFGAGWLMGRAEGGYRLARVVAGVLQSPVPFVVLFIIGPLFKNRSLSAATNRGASGQ